MEPFFMNSVRMVIPAVLISSIVGAFNGYVLTHWRFRGADAVFTMLLVGCFIPFQAILLPMARLQGILGLANTTTGLVLVHVVYGIAFTTMFFRNFYVSIPAELVKAARIDGAGFFTIFTTDPAACVAAYFHGVPDLAIHADLERLPVRYRVLRR